MNLSKLIIEGIATFPSEVPNFTPADYAAFKVGLKSQVSNISFGRSVSKAQGDVEYGFQDKKEGAFFKYAFDTQVMHFDPDKSVSGKDGNIFRLSSEKRVRELVGLGQNANLNKV